MWLIHRRGIAGLSAAVGLLVLSGAVAVERLEPRETTDLSPRSGVHGESAFPGKVDINSASAVDLERLPGMTEKLSRRIIAHRPYRKIDDLVRRKILGRKQMAGIKEYITVGSTESEANPARSP